MTGSVAKNTFGSHLWLCPAGGSLVKLAEGNVVSAPALTRGTIDATTHDGASQAMEVIDEGVYDVGEIEFEGNYIANSTDDQAIMTAVTTGAKQDFKIVEKGSSGARKITGSGYVTAYSPDPYPVKGKQTFKLTIKPTGAITKAADS